MNNPRIIVKQGFKRPGMSPAPEAGWYLLGGIGVVFLLVAGADLLLAWVPLDFGNVEWKFGTVSTTLEHLPVFVVGLGLIFGSAAGRGNRMMLRVVSLVFLILAALALMGAVIYVTTIPAARAAVTDPVLKSGLDRAILKTVFKAIVYPIAFAWIGIKGWRHSQPA